MGKGDGNADGGGLEITSVYDGASRLSSKIKQTLPFPSLVCHPRGRGCKKVGRGSGDDLNTFKGLSLTASVLPVHRLQGCSPLY